MCFRCVDLTEKQAEILEKYHCAACQAEGVGPSISKLMEKMSDRVVSTKEKRLYIFDYGTVFFHDDIDPFYFHRTSEDQ